MIPLKLSFNLESMASFTIKTASKICLSSTNACWKPKITLANTFCSLLVRTFARGFYNPSTKLIDLKSFRSPGPCLFRIKTRNMVFKLLSKDPKSWNSAKKAIISSFTKFLQTAKRLWRSHSVHKLDKAENTSSLEKWSSKASESTMDKESNSIPLMLDLHSPNLDRITWKAFATLSLMSSSLGNVLQFTLILAKKILCLCSLVVLWKKI